MAALGLKLLMYAAGIALYATGELKNKFFKYITGIPVGIAYAIIWHSWIPLICWLTYWAATEVGYGDNNWLTKLIGKRGAITVAGIALGAAAAPIMLYWAVLQAIIGGVGFYILAVLDDADKLKEPYIGILRPAVALIGLLWMWTKWSI